MRVLLIEDYPPVIRALKLGLEEEGYAIDVVHSTEEGLQRAWKSHYNIILLDLQVSPEGGFSLLQAWRHAGLTTHVLALTSPERFQDKVRSLDLGADDCLTKPFAFEELLARMRALARRSVPNHNPVVRVADLEIDPTVRVVRRGGRSIYLTPREFSLLQFLAEHKGKVVSRSMIWQHLYDDKARSASNVVDVYIRYLRNKIDKGFTRPLIQTRWGEGYLLRGEEI
jgi:DNA-binding response OmpR family regulator